MADSVSYNLLILGSLVIISGLDRWWKYILIGIISGFFPLLRNNYLIFSLLLIFLSSVKNFLAHENKINKLNLALLVVPFLLIQIIYINTIVYPRLGVKQINTFGGRTLFSSVMGFTACNKLKNIRIERNFLKALVDTCDETSRQDYSETLHADNGLISIVNDKLQLSTARSDAFYFETARQLILKNPTVILKIFSKNVQKIITADDSFYQSNRYPKGALCAEYLDKFNIDYRVFLNENSRNFSNPLILAFAFLAAQSQKILIGVMYLVIPFWLIIRIIKIGLTYFIKIYWELLVIWFVAVMYFALTISITQFDYRFVLPLWIMAAWIYKQSKID